MYAGGQFPEKMSDVLEKHQHYILVIKNEGTSLKVADFKKEGDLQIQSQSRISRFVQKKRFQTVVTNTDFEAKLDSAIDRKN